MLLSNTVLAIFVVNFSHFLIMLHMVDILPDVLEDDVEFVFVWVLYSTFHIVVMCSMVKDIHAQNKR